MRRQLKTGPLPFTGKGVQQVNEGTPARWRLKEAAN
jgi:hypothetical protein